VISGFLNSYHACDAACLSDEKKSVPRYDTQMIPPFYPAGQLLANLLTVLLRRPVMLVTKGRDLQHILVGADRALWRNGGEL
jgi:hypothetical protein